MWCLRCVKYIKQINQIKSVGLMICDEGHRLKNSTGNKTIRALKSFRTNRIVLLTGTPVQNRLEEFYAMADFCNPMILGDLKTFKAVYQVPIDRGRDKNAKKEVKELGEKRSQGNTGGTGGTGGTRVCNDGRVCFVGLTSLFIIVCCISCIGLVLFSVVQNHEFLCPASHG
jgi:hypothetical protein